jgi:hypothetical protein
MTPEELDFIEKVKIPEYESYGWANATKDLRLVIGEARRLMQELAKKTEEAQLLAEKSSAEITEISEELHQRKEQSAIFEEGK